EPLHTRLTRWSTYLHTSNFCPLITEVLTLELPKYTSSTVDLPPTFPPSLAAIIFECLLILCSSGPLFTAAVDGTLSRGFLASEDLRTSHEHMTQKARLGQPHIYAHFLVSPHGIPPSPTHLLAIRDVLQTYLSQTADANALAHAIDNISATSTPFPPVLSAAGLRKYLRTEHNVNSLTRIESLYKLCSGLTRVHNATAPEERDIPSRYPISECGYALDAIRRIQQHRGRRGSNYVMNLVEDVCRYLHRNSPDFPEYRMRPWIIYSIFRAQQAGVAEMLCSGLLGVWVEEGGGVNHYPAGLSVRSAWLVEPEEW
ncbi:hypothetical protein M011DRAFT_380221, partial [Sporormia fimetaria CBS 119925]